MATKSRVKNNTVHIRFSFGRSKAGLEFANNEEFHGYICEDFGDGINFSHNEVPASPFIWIVEAVKRDECWNKTERITELVAALYKSREVNYSMAS